MKYRQSFLKYLEKGAITNNRPFYSRSLDDIHQVVVIPCFAESKYLFKTLASLAENTRSDLKNTLILCVVNNRSMAIHTSGVIEDNLFTMQCLDMLIAGNMTEDIKPHVEQLDLLNEILKTNIRVSYIDASSAGFEMPDNGGGVGMARKIGLDLALTLFDNKKNNINLLCCLDADTIVENNYLSAVRSFFIEKKATAAYVSFAHQEAEEPSMQSAICCYEIFLRYYVTGLYYSGSPYAFHTIGSTIICTSDGYAAVRGMNRRDAAEDFYFLNKLAKLDGVGSIRTTTVHPSARTSQRVPFGTGQAVLRFNNELGNNCLVYNPDIFFLLKNWIEFAESACDRDAKEIMTMKAAKNIHPLLESFLCIYNFNEIWQRIRKNSPNSIVLKRQFHGWFDGFKTLKLVHYLSDKSIPPLCLFDAVDKLLKMMNKNFNFNMGQLVFPNLDEQMRLLDFLKKDFPV